MLTPGWSLLFVCFLFFFFRPADLSTQHWAMVLEMEPLNRGTGLYFFLVLFFVVFFCRPVDALFSSEPGGGQGNVSTLAVAQDCIFCLLFFVMYVILIYLYVF